MISHSWADYGDTDKIYPQIFDYIEKQQYVITGDAYEEYLQDEVSLQNHGTDSRTVELMTLGLFSCLAALTLLHTHK